MKYAFENLEVWQKSRKLVKSVYQLTNAFPNEEKVEFIVSINQKTYQPIN